MAQRAGDPHGGTFGPVHRETMVQELKRYVRWSEVDARILRGFRARAAPHFERIAIYARFSRSAFAGV